MRIHERRGAAIVETALVMSGLLLVVVGLLDMAIAVFRYNTLSAAAREGARRATVHGELAPPKQTQWGPDPFTGTAATDHQIAQVIRPMVVGFTPADVQIHAEWLDGGCAVEQRVRFTLSSNYTPMITMLFGGRTFVLRASSTMPINH